MNRPVPHVYSWAKARGVFGRRNDCAVSHLLFDGGVLSVPPGVAFEFLHEYSRGVVTRGPAPCIVEVRTPVFRMFYDLDAHATEGLAAELSRGVVAEPVDAVIRAIVGATAELFRTDDPRAVVCVADAPKSLGTAGPDGTLLAKIGVHVTFDGIFASAASARYVRERVLERLASVRNPFANDFPGIVDEAVYKGSGMRLPWSAKKGEPRAYVPIGEWTPAGRSSNIDPSAVVRSVTEARALLARVTLRTDHASPTPLADRPDGLPPDGYAPAEHSTSLSHASLRDYAAMVPTIESAIPDVYRGRITGVVRGDHAMIFRHSSRYCANVGREHHTSNTYFVLTREGLRQCCYSRKDDEHEWGSCKAFRGDLVPLPREVVDACLPVRPTPPAVPAMPSAGAGVRVAEVLARPSGGAKRFKPTKPRPSGFMNPFQLARGHVP